MRSACALNSRCRSLRSLVLQTISTFARRKCCYHLVYAASRCLLFELRVSGANDFANRGRRLGAGAFGGFLRAEPLTAL